MINSFSSLNDCHIKTYNFSPSRCPISNHWMRCDIDRGQLVRWCSDQMKSIDYDGRDMIRPDLLGWNYYPLDTIFRNFVAKLQLNFQHVLNMHSACLRTSKGWNFFISKWNATTKQLRETKAAEVREKLKEEEKLKKNNTDWLHSIYRVYM